VYFINRRQTKQVMTNEQHNTQTRPLATSATGRLTLKLQQQPKIA